MAQDFWASQDGGLSWRCMSQVWHEDSVGKNPWLFRLDVDVCLRLVNQRGKSRECKVVELGV